MTIPTSDINFWKWLADRGLVLLMIMGMFWLLDAHLEQWIETQSELTEAIKASTQNHQERMALTEDILVSLNNLFQEIAEKID